jgi:hypothetical protein
MANIITEEDACHIFTLISTFTPGPASNTTNLQQATSIQQLPLADRLEDRDNLYLSAIRDIVTDESESGSIFTAFIDLA